MSEPTTENGRLLLAYLRGLPEGMVLIGARNGVVIAAIETEAIAAERARLREEVRGLRVHSIHGFEWECSECHYHFPKTKCPQHGLTEEGEFDWTGAPANHDTLLFQPNVLALLEDPK